MARNSMHRDLELLMAAMEGPTRGALTVPRIEDVLRGYANGMTPLQLDPELYAAAQRAYQEWLKKPLEQYFN